MAFIDRMFARKPPQVEWEGVDVTDPTLWEPEKRGAFKLWAWITVGALFTAFFWVSTQYAAWRFGYEPSLGAPLYRAGDSPGSFAMYQPLASVGWCFDDTVRPWPQGGRPIASVLAVWQDVWLFFWAPIGTFVLLALPYLTSKPKTRRKPLHGTQHWASNREIEEHTGPEGSDLLVVKGFAFKGKAGPLRWWQTLLAKLRKKD